MFRWIQTPDRQQSLDGVQSAEGYTFIRADHFSYHYSTQGRTLRVEVQRSVDAHGYGELIYLESLRRWQPPHDAVEIPEGDRQKIRAHIENALGFMGVRCHFQESE